MPGSIYLPEPVKQAIAAHVEKAVTKVESLYDSAAQDEDTLTGQLGGALSAREQTVTVRSDDASGQWQWDISYTKFRGRGKGAPENLVGADGIIELHARNHDGSETKSLLFQAKNDWDSDTNLLTQAVKLSNWREAAVVIDFRPETIEVFNLDDIIASRGKRSGAGSPQHFTTFFVDEYLACHIGDTRLRYDARGHRLIWLSQSGNVVAAKFQIRSRLRVNVVGPDAAKAEPMLLSDDDVFRHRIAASPYEILGLDHNASEADTKKRVRRIRKALHPDSHGYLDDRWRKVLDQRLQEVNAAYDAT